jgi:hypothetical protein
VKALLRLYPRSWRNRYGGEMDALVEELPGKIGVALDLLIGAAKAYASVIRGNRLLSSAASFLHGVSVAVLVQAIAFVTLVLVTQRSADQIIVAVGPIQLAFTDPGLIRLHSSFSSLLGAPIGSSSTPILLIALLAILALVLAGPRWVMRHMKTMQ